MELLGIVNHANEVARPYIVLISTPKTIYNIVDSPLTPHVLDVQKP